MGCFWISGKKHPFPAFPCLAGEEEVMLLWSGRLAAARLRLLQRIADRTRLRRQNSLTSSTWGVSETMHGSPQAGPFGKGALYFGRKCAAPRSERITVTRTLAGVPPLIRMLPGRTSWTETSARRSPPK